MEDPRSGLSEIYGQMSDEELLERWRGGQLTDIAVEVAGAELLKRGTPVSDYVSAAQDDPAIGGEEPREFVEVARSLSPSELEILRARLESEGIPSLLTDANTNRMNPLWSIAIGGARLLVPRQYADAASEIIGLVRSGAFTLDENEELE